MRIIPYLIYLLIVAFYEVTLIDLTAVWGVTFDLPAIFVLGVALYKSEGTALWFGFAVGLVSGAATPTLMGWHGLITALLGLTAFHFRERLNLDSLWSKLLLVIAGTLVYNVMMAAVDGLDGYFRQLWTVILPGTVYTAIVAWIFFLFKEKRVTIQKIKALF